MHDNFFGGEPYGGRQVISVSSEPYWICTYYGSVEPGVVEVGRLYDVLHEALQKPDPEKPYRGPELLHIDDFTYRNTVKGDIGRFKGREVILKDGVIVYWAEYMGGLIDQREKGAY